MTSQIPDPNDPGQAGAPQGPPSGTPGTPGQPEAPQAPQPPQDPQPPQAPGAPADGPGTQAPPAGGQQYAAPQQPQYEQPQYAQPGQQGQYIPPQAQPVGSSLQLNYWLSVFFIFIPALIFFLTEKGRSPKLDQFNRENLNFSLIRTGVWLITVIFTAIPILGWLIWLVGLIAQIVLFVFHILAAAKVKENFDAGRDPGFIFNIPLVK